MKPKDVTIKVPPAMWPVGAAFLPSPLDAAEMEPPSPEDLVVLQNARINELEREVAALKVATDTISNMACCLTKILCDLGYGSDVDTVAIPRELSDWMEGASITIGEVKRGIIALKFTHRMKNIRVIPGG